MARRISTDPRKIASGELEPAKPGGWDPKRMEDSVTKKVSGGNSRPDQEWLRTASQNGELMELIVKPDDCPWDVKFQWDGYSDEVNLDFFEDFRRYKRQCTGIAYIRDERGGYILDLDGVRLVRPCLRPPMVGGMVCNKHGGQLTWVKEAAERRLSHAAEKAANTLIVLTDPRDELNNLVEQGVRVKAANSVLDRVGIKAGSTVEIEVPGYKTVLEQAFSEEGEGEE